ncbi:MAG: radical SAM protein [Phaeospirillum sp.]|nr:radical SAM protein [Phaeospirillum sp.]
MSDGYDLILICQSNIVDYESYSHLPIEAIDRYKTLVYPRMVRHDDRFVGHLDAINLSRHGGTYFDADYATRRQRLNIWNMPSASGLHLANILSAHGIRTRIINNIDSEWDWFEEAYNRCSTPPLVGISSTFYLGFKEVGRVARRLRAFDTDMEIVLGGAFTNSRALSGGAESLERPMRKYGIDYVLHAFNSDTDLLALMLARKGGADLDQVANLCRFDGGFAKGRFTASASRWNPPMLDEVPANWDKVEAPYLNRTLQIRTASGCPFSCSFCSYPTTAGGWKTIEPERVRAHLDAVKRIPGIDRLIFIDDTFNVPKHRFKELLEIFKDYDFEWFSFLRVQYVDEDIVRAMKDSGCRGVYLGVESADDRVLANMNKKARREDFARGIELLNRFDITSLSAFVLGFPGETDASIQANVDFIENCGVDFYSLKEFFYMEHTDIHKKRDQYGLTGMGNRWSHDTMTSDRASDIKLEMFRSIKNAVSLDPDTSLWYLAYLYDQGYGVDGIKDMQRSINAISMDQMDGDMSSKTAAWDSLRVNAVRSAAG